MAYPLGKLVGGRLIISSPLFEISRFLPVYIHILASFLMRRKKKEIEEITPQYTLYQLASDYYPTSRFITPEDRLFCVLLLSGYPAAAAYRVSYQTSASVASSAVLASRRLHEPYIQKLLDHINQNYWAAQIILKTDCYKGKAKRWPKWMPPKSKRLDPTAD